MAEGDQTQTADFLTLKRLLINRHSCRSFLPVPVKRDVITSILEIASRAASWCNSQPWQVIVTSGEETDAFRNALYAHAASALHQAKYDYAAPEKYEGCYLERRRSCGLALYKSLGIGRDDNAEIRLQGLENFHFFGAPHTAIITAPLDLRTYGAIDCGAYIGTFLLAAESVGIGAVAQAALAAYPDFIRDHFELPPERRIICGISFGYEDREHPANGFRTGRAPLSDTVIWRGLA